jgi:hypothetical protein
MMCKRSATTSSFLASNAFDVAKLRASGLALGPSRRHGISRHRFDGRHPGGVSKFFTRQRWNAQSRRGIESAPHLTGGHFPVAFLPLNAHRACV